MIIIRTGNKQDYVGKQDKDRKENLMGLKKTATLLVMMLVLFTALDTRADEQRTGIYNTPAVNLRIMPSLTSLSLGLANKGASCEILEETTVGDTVFQGTGSGGQLRCAVCQGRSAGGHCGCASGQAGSPCVQLRQAGMKL